MKVLIGSAWPYANGSLHIGHLAGLLPADVIARYYRARGDDVYLVSGSDCHGTPVAIRAKQENKSPREISDYYHAEFCECFDKLGFCYDRYSKTSSEEHISFIREFHETMYGREYIYEREAPQAFCDRCGTALADRFVLVSARIAANRRGATSATPAASCWKRRTCWNRAALCAGRRPCFARQNICILRYPN